MNVRVYLSYNIHLRKEFNFWNVHGIMNTRGDQKVRGKVLLYHSAFIDCNENSLIETTIHSKLTEIEI